MDKDETELQDSPQPDEEVDESQEDESEILKKNKQLFERAKKAEQKAKDLEEQIANLSEQSDDEEDDERTSSDIKNLQKELSQMKEKAELEKLYAEYPALASKLDEFDEFRLENGGMSLTTAAKAFLVERDLYNTEPQREGLEPARGGIKTPPTSGKMTSEDVKTLRENNYLEYKRLLSEGKIQIAD